MYLQDRLIAQCQKLTSIHKDGILSPWCSAKHLYETNVIYMDIWPNKSAIVNHQIFMTTITMWSDSDKKTDSAWISTLHLHILKSARLVQDRQTTVIINNFHNKWQWTSLKTMAYIYTPILVMQYRSIHLYTGSQQSFRWIFSQTLRTMSASFERWHAVKFYWCSYAGIQFHYPYIPLYINCITYKH